MNNKLLITGASGFVGYHLINAALAQGYEVYAAVRANSQVQHLQGLNIQYINLDFTAVPQLKQVLEQQQFSYIIHAAGSTKAKDQSSYNFVNAEFSKNLALAASLANIDLKKFIFVSSLAALGPIADFGAILQDNSPANPVTAYGISKNIAETYLNDIDNLPLITVRPTAVYGPREKDLFILFKTINQGLEPYIGHFNQQLSFIYVKDLAELILKALTSDIVGKTYNISDGNAYNRYALADNLKKALHKKTLKLHIPLGMIKGLATVMDSIYANSSKTPTLNKEKIKELTAPNWACNINNLVTDFGFQPQYDLEKGIYETVAWYKQNNWLK